MAVPYKTAFDTEPVLEFEEPASKYGEAADDVASEQSIRTCVVSRERRKKTALLRFVLSPGDIVVPDLREDLPGRGVWVTANRNAVRQAVRTRAFNRAFRTAVHAEETLPDSVEYLLRCRALAGLSIANKAGALVTGYTKVDAALSQGCLTALVHADTAALDGKRKLDRKFAAVSAPGSHIVFENCFTSAEISLAAGSVNVIHAGLREGGAGRAFLDSATRFVEFRKAEA